MSLGVLSHSQYKNYESETFPFDILDRPLPFSPWQQTPCEMSHSEHQRLFWCLVASPFSGFKALDGTSLSNPFDSSQHQLGTFGVIRDQKHLFH